MTAVARSICLNENEVLALLRASPTSSGASAARSHIDACEACESLLACMVEGTGVEESGPVSVGRSAALSSGQTIGRYRIQKELGAGAMGVVYLAEDPQLHRTVAVKVHQRQEAAAAELLLREARSLARLSHPNVIVVHEVGTYEGNVFMAMEFVDGGSLGSWLVRSERSTAEIVDVFAQAARGLAVAHAAGLVHRDFKPDNVLVGLDGRVRVVDFGLAREVMFTSLEQSPPPADPLARTYADASTLTRTGTIVGTPAYMAPEQWAGGRADARTDQFAFAVALFEALYGQRPFLGDTFAVLAQAVSTGQVVVPRQSRRKVPKPMARALVRSLSVDPAQRFASMEALVAALTQNERKVRAIAAGAVVAVALGGALAFMKHSSPLSVALPESPAALPEPPVAANVAVEPPPAPPSSSAENARPVVHEATPAAAGARSKASPSERAVRPARQDRAPAPPSKDLFDSIN